MSIEEQLKAPFPPEKIHWRLGATNAKKMAPAKATKGIALAYIDARDVMDRLDEVIGIWGWESHFTETASGRILCKLTVGVDNPDGGINWVTKTDGAGDTGTEGEKGAISDALKRAAVNFGIGRYLYSIKNTWVDLDNGYLPRNFDGSRYLSEAPTPPPAKPNGKVWDYAENAAKSGTVGLESWFNGLERGEKAYIKNNHPKWEKIKGTAADWDAKADEESYTETPEK